ncbi:hypothetical protein [Bradyrhizobium sp. CCBAU 51745]|uniref:hypothetical protein n=1 Tax=Bradyrhizobium sp. CCBAU 51745 TaxID=1325099 RepID=UPI0023058FD2|nr:hypothetical protein [Bradyrhizobium sp. CCBAU 51745]
MPCSRRHTPTHADGRPLKITLGDLRSTGVRDLIVFCLDYRCSHNVKLAAVYVDRWPNELRISQLEPRFVCTACGMRGSCIVAGSNGTEQAILPSKIRSAPMD